MSYSSLWVMDKNFYGKKTEIFHDSWIFAPLVADILFEKYLPNKVYDSLGGKTSFMVKLMSDNNMISELALTIINSQNQEDLIMWELCNERVFFSKDKEAFANIIRNFLSNNTILTEDLGERIHKRFNEVADSILSIDEKEHPYFIFKKTSTNDNVEFWFKKYDDELKRDIDRSLKEINNKVVYFMPIENNAIKQAIDNIRYLNSGIE